MEGMEDGVDTSTFHTVVAGLNDGMRAMERDGGCMGEEQQLGQEQEWT